MSQSPPRPASEPARVRWRLLRAVSGRRLALVGTMAALAAAAWVGQTWRQQGREVRDAYDARRALSSVALAVQTQRALAAHRPIAAAVLGGREAQEPERLRRQQAVDQDVGALVAALETQPLARALDEADLLRHDWTALAEAIGQRQLAPAASDRAHDLLVEQGFVVIDLVHVGSSLRGQLSRRVAGAPWHLATQALPRLAVALAAAPADAPGHTGDGAQAVTAAPATAAAVPATAPVHAEARRVARAAAAALRILDAGGADEPAPDPALVRALAALQQHAGSAAQPGPHDGRLAAAALTAETALFAHLDRQMAEAAVAIGRERLGLAAFGLALLLVAGLAAAQALPPTRGTAWSPMPADPGAARSATADAADAAEAANVAGERVTIGAIGPIDTSTHTDAAPGGESFAPVSDLLQRLRQGAPAWAAAGPSRTPTDPASPPAEPQRQPPP